MMNEKILNLKLRAYSDRSPHIVNAILNKQFEYMTTWSMIQCIEQNYS